jgi:hypothetical protein
MTHSRNGGPILCSYVIETNLCYCSSKRLAECGHTLDILTDPSTRSGAARGFVAEQRGAIAVVLRKSGAAEPEELSAEVRRAVIAELEASLDRLEEGLDPKSFSRVARLLAQPVLGDSDESGRPQELEQ